VEPRYYKVPKLITGVCYVGVISTYFTITGLKNIARYTGAFVIPGPSLYPGRCTGVHYVRFHCSRVESNVV